MKVTYFPIIYNMIKIIKKLHRRGQILYKTLHVFGLDIVFSIKKLFNSRKFTITDNYIFLPNILNHKMYLYKFKNKIN